MGASTKKKFSPAASKLLKKAAAKRRRSERASLVEEEEPQKLATDKHGAILVDNTPGSHGRLVIAKRAFGLSKEEALAQAEQWKGFGGYTPFFVCPLEE